VAAVEGDADDDAAAVVEDPGTDDELDEQAPTARAALTVAASRAAEGCRRITEVTPSDRLRIMSINLIE